MATVYRENKKRPTMQYISTAAFNNNFYTYNLTTNPSTFVTTGSLDPVTDATSVNCPAGHILRETGRRLFPGAHPGVTTLMVMVFDVDSQLKGFIDPNASVFAVFNTDKPCELVDGTDTTLGVHRGPSVFTFGSVTAGTGVVATTGGVTATAGGVTATAGSIRAATVTNSTTTTGALTVNPALGNVFTFSATLTGAVTIAATSVASTSGQSITVMFTDGGGRALTAADATFVLNGSATLTNAKRAVFTFVSNGTSFFEVSRVIYT